MNVVKACVIAALAGLAGQLLLSGHPAAAAPQAVMDPPILGRIIGEATENSRVMEHLFYLTDVYGSRLTGSPGFSASGEWAVKTLQGYGLGDVRKEPLGPVSLGGGVLWSGRGWSFSKCSVRMLEPQQTPLLAVPAGWSEGTHGLVSGPAIFAPFPALYEEDLAAYFTKFQGQLKGKIVMLADQPRPIDPQSAGAFLRFSEDELAQIARAPESGSRPAPAGPPPAARPRLSVQQQLDGWNTLFAFLKKEGVLALVEPAKGQGGTLFTRDQLGPPDPSPDPPPTVSVASEHYNRLVRLMKNGIPVTLEIEVEAQFHLNQDHFNVLADLPGTSRKDEVVMLGAHLDSWFGATGATDNAAGVAVVMEAARVLKALNLRLDRTVRIALWGAEEANGAGSKAYVAKYLLDPKTGERKPLYDKLSVYLNIDNGAGKIRGIYLQGNLGAKATFDAWMRPLGALGATTVSVRDSYGSDHMAFDGAGIPAFAVIQDPLNYESRTHHSTMDAADYVPAEDLKASAAALAALAYQASVAPEMVPRKMPSGAK